MPITLQESLRGLFYAPFYAALARDAYAAEGVDVRFINNEAVIDLYVIIEYGTRIVSVAHSVQNLVKFNVEKALGLPVASINVHVQGLRVSDNGE